MTAVVLLAVVGQLRAGPMDAFTLNRRAIRAQFDFSFSVGKIDKDNLIKKRLWNESHFAKVDVPHMRVAGHWDSDGTAEHTICGPTDEAGRPVPRVGKAGQITSGEPAMETLSDGDLSAFHGTEDDTGIQVEIRSGSHVSYGPFHYFLEDLPFMLKRIFPNGSNRPVGTTTVNGHRCEYETYILGDSRSFYEQTVCYDPEIGYLPRYIRCLTFLPDGPMGNTADVAEYFLVRAQQCKAGGFVPLAWNVAKYEIDRFAGRYPGYKTLDPLEPHDGDVTVYNFIGHDFQDKTSPARLTQIAKNSVLSYKGWLVELNDNPRSLSLGQIRGRLGTKLTRPANRVRPTLDSEELTRKFTGPPRWPLRLGLMIAAVGVIALTAGRVRRELRTHGTRLTLCLASLLLGLTGCTSETRPLYGLVGSFTENTIVYPNKQAAFDVNLKIKNRGNSPIKILDINGGCSCRKVDLSNLPARLPVDGEAVFRVSLQNKGNFENQVFPFEVQTDAVKLTVAAPLFALPDHSVDPSSLTFNIVGQVGDSPIEFTHREVFDDREIPAECTITGSEAVKIAKGPTTLGKVSGDRRFTFRDTTYSLSVVDRSLGIHKEMLQISRAAAHSEFEVPVLWTRSEFVTPMPERVLLKPTPTRVFLRCPDDNVEITEILAQPAGVRAVVASPREIIANLTADAPDVIEDYVLAATNSPGGERLKIPVIRYAPRKPGESWIR